MNHKEKVQQWLKALGARNNSVLELNEDGWCAFFSGSVRCDLFVFENIPMIRLISPLMETPDGETEGVMKWFLEQNFINDFTQGAIFAIDSENEEVVLLYDHLITELDTEEDFMAMVTDFIDAAQKFPDRFNHWMENQFDSKEVEAEVELARTENRIFG